MRLFRGFLVLAGAITLVFALLAALAGEYWLGLSNALVGGGLLLFGSWAWSHPAALPVRQWAALGLIGAGFVVVGQVVLALVLLGGLLLINVLTGTFMLRRVSGVEFELLGPDAVMPGAKDLVSEFEAEGFRRAGGYRGRIPILRKLVTCTVLTGPTRDSFAVVTDRVWEVVSRFGQRWLITTSSGVTPASPGVLRQTVHDARPTELVRAHQAALEHLAASELRPDRLEDDGAVVQSAVAVENDAARFIGRAPMKSVLAMETRGKSDYPVLGDDDRSRRRIDAWLYSAEPG